MFRYKLISNEITNVTLKIKITLLIIRSAVD